MHASCIALLCPPIHSSRPVCRFSCAILEHARTLAHGLKCAHRAASVAHDATFRQTPCLSGASESASMLQHRSSSWHVPLVLCLPRLASDSKFSWRRHLLSLVLAFAVISAPSHRHCTVITNFACERRTRSALTATAAAMESTRTWTLHRLRHRDVVLKSALFRARV